jgi:glycosyltransferase involved in cell wall biosynthesis
VGAIPTYVVVSAVKNEARNIQHTIRSMVAQTIRPLAWMIVDDGSTDTTAEVVALACREHAWISFMRHRIAGSYDLSGGSEIRAFYHGYKSIRHLDFKFLAKLDGDISFGQDYFEQLLHRFLSNGRLGIASGTVYNYDPRNPSGGSVEQRTNSMSEEPRVFTAGSVGNRWAEHTSNSVGMPWTSIGPACWAGRLAALIRYP